MNVDIIMPVHNPDKYVINAIDSCLSQSYRRCKLTVIDDCSTSSISSLVKRYPMVTFLKTPRNLGPGGARNFGINNTKGNLISFLDDDDVMCRQKVEWSVDEFVKDPKIGLVCGNYRILVNGALRSPFYKRPININYNSLMRQNLVASGSTTVSRDAVYDVGMFNEEYWIGEDYDLWLKLSQKYSIKYIDKVLYHYRIIPGGDSLTQRADIQEKHMSNLNKIKQESIRRAVYEAKRKAKHTD